MVLLYNSHVTGWRLLIATCLAATAGIGAAGTLYGVLAAGLRVRETLLPLLLLPVLAPVLIGSTRAFEAARRRQRPARAGPGWVCWPCSPSPTPSFGALGFGTLLEDS